MPRRTATPASSSWRTTRICCSTGARRRPRDGPRSSRSARRTSRASRGGRRVSAMRGATDRVATATPSVLRIWLMAARPKTLPVGLAPVLVGTALAGTADVFHPLRFVAALLGALFIQVGANLSNDYSDARRGADTEDRLGPVRVTAGGLVPPRQVLI